MKFIDNKVTLLNPSGFENALPKISANKNVTDISNNKVLSLAVDYLRIPSKEFDENPMFGNFMWDVEPGIRIIKKPDFVYITACQNLITHNLEKYKINAMLYPDNFEKFYTFKVKCSKKAFRVMKELHEKLTIELFTLYAHVDYEKPLEVIPPQFVTDEVENTEFTEEDVAPDRVIMTIMQKKYSAETMIAASNYIAEEACFKQLCTMHPDKHSKYEESLLSEQVSLTVYVSTWESEILQKHDSIRNKEVLQILDSMKEAITEKNNDKNN